MNKHQAIISESLAQTAATLLTLEAAKKTGYQKGFLKPLPGPIIDPNSSLTNPDHAKARGTFALGIIEKYSHVPGIDAQEFETSAKSLLSTLESHESFPKTFANASNTLAGAEDDIHREDKVYQLSMILGSAVAMAIVLVAGVGDTAPNLVSRLFSKQASAGTAARVSEGIDKGEVSSLTEEKLPVINQTILKILLNTKQTANPFIKDGIERFERFLQKEGTITKPESKLKPEGKTKPEAKTKQP